MGEIAEAMLEGALCEGCGVYLGEGDGFPRRCGGCGGDAAEFVPPELSNKKGREKKLQCGGCKKWFASKSAQHAHAEAKGHPKL